MKLAYYFNLLFICIGLNACMDSGIINQSANSGLNNNANNNIQTIIPTSFQTQPHTSTSAYYTNVSNNSRYIAFSIQVKTTSKVNSISLESNTNNTFSFSAESSGA